MCYLFKILKSQSPDYLSKTLPSIRGAYTTRNADCIPCFNIKHNFFRYSFFPSTLIEWNNLDINITKSKSYTTFKKSILRFIRPSKYLTFNCHNPSGIKLITRLKLGLSHLRKHKFRHNFLDTLNPISSCGKNIETTTHYLLHCSNYLNERLRLLTNLQNVEENNLDKNYSRLSEILLFSDSSFNDAKNTSTLNSTIQYIFDTKRFNVPLINL